MGIAALTRAWLTAANDFPINDGALFATYIDAIQSTFPKLPTHVVFNGTRLPFAYPPLSFMAGALLTLAGADTLDVLRLVPTLLYILYVGLFARLLITMGYDHLFAACTVGVFCIIPRSYEWLVMGGGISRGFGAVFFMLTLAAAHRLASAPALSHKWLPVGACVAAASLSHLEWGLLAYFAALAMLCLPEHRGPRVVARWTAVSLAAAALTAPWILWLVTSGGASALVSAGGTSGWGIAGSLSTAAQLLISQWPNALLIVGLVAACRQQQLFWPVVMLLCIVVTPRHGLTPLAIPVSVLTVIGVARITRVIRHRSNLFAVVVSLSALVLTLGSLAQNAKTARWFGTLSEDRLAAMAWVRGNHPADRFVIITPAPWQYDATAEWFPYMTNATNATTAQGLEWGSRGAFRRRVELINRVKFSDSCARVHAAINTLGPVDYIWLESRHSCFSGAAQETVYKSGQITILRYLE